MNETYEMICQFVNWNKETKVDEKKLMLMQSFSPEVLMEAHEYAKGLYGRLREAGIERDIAEYNGYYGDSVHDCMTELVAHGEEYVQHVIENPDIALNRFKDDDYTENFFYVFPYDEDWSLLDAPHYWGSVCRLNQVLRDFLSGKDTSVVTRYDEKFNIIPNKLSHEQVKMIADVLEEIWNLKWNSNRDYDTIYKNSEDLGHGAWLANLWSDFGKYYAKVHPESVIGDGKYRRYSDEAA